MRLKPVRFIGHNIGPFDHVELNWDKDSRYTLIVAENGLGKTTLVAAMAACLSLGARDLFLDDDFQRFAHSEDSYAYFELGWRGKTSWIFRDSLLNRDPETYELLKQSVGLPDLASEGQTYVGLGGYRTTFSHDWSSIKSAWNATHKVDVLTAAYGVSRDIQQTKIQGYQELGGKPLSNILNPFAPIPSSKIFQWVANLYVNYALALAKDEEDEAQAYLAAMKRVEQLLSEGLEHPLTFQVEQNPFRLEVRQNGVLLSIDQLSDGTRSFLSWPLDYLMRASRVNWANPADSAVAPGLILVDEIDAHLHPEWQRRVMPAISQLLPETYIIATTHSPFVVGAAEDAQVFRIRQDLSVQTDLDELYGYPADLVLEKAFVPSLYAPELERKLNRLSTLAGKIAAGDVTPQEKGEHDALLRELAEVNPWLNNLLAMSQMKGPGT